MRPIAASTFLLWMASSLVARANLLRNPGFESVPGAATGEGLMPIDWFTVSGTPDTYSVGGTYGLAPSYQSNFTGMTAAQGSRWVAAWSGAPEQFAQTLTAPLVAGRSYVLSAALLQSARTSVDHPASYRVLLVDPTTLQGIVVGEFTGTSSPSQGWVRQSFTFSAPATAAALTRIQFRPIATSTGGHGYPALDDLNLTETGGSLSGSVTLDAFLGSPSDVAVVVDIRNPGTTTVRETHTVTLDPTGQYAFATQLSGTFDVAIRGPHWLQIVVAGGRFRVRSLPGS